MNKTFNSFLLLLSSTFLLASCNGGDNNSSSVVAEASLTLSQSALSLEAYETSTLTYTLTGKEGTPTWTSSDASVATVDTSGKVTALKAGSCTITATLDELSATCEVTVTTISQAPRIVLGEPSVSLDKGSAYTIDAYTIYKNEARDDNLEISLKSGADESIASVSYSNKKITVNGLKYGSTDFVVHANVLGVLVTASLHVTVVNADVALKLGNIDLKDGDYSLNLGLYRVDEDDLPTEFTPEVIFTDKEQPATYELAYTTSDATIATWDENHKILAKGIGETTVKIACEQFGLALEIKVSVVKGAYDVTLKNIGEAGTTSTEKVGANKAPKTTPSVDGKTFIGWYDDDGNKITSVTEDMTLTAHYSKEYEYDGNTVVKKFTNNDSDYSQPEGTDWKYSARGSDRDGDISNGYYPAGVDGTQCFFYPSTADAIAGVGLPAYDFSTGPTIRFTFGFSDTAKSVTFNGTDVGDDTKAMKFSNYTVTIRGKEAIVDNYGLNTSTKIALSDDVYYGRKGIEITATEVPWRWLMITPFISLDVDYLTVNSQIEKALPDTPVLEDEYVANVKTYQTLRALYSEGENSLFPISDKMKSWIDGITPVTLADFTNNENMTVTGNVSHEAGIYETVTSPSASRLGGCPVYDGDSKSFIAQLNDLTASFGSVTFPTIDYSAYKSVSFTFGMTGNIGQYADRYFLLGDAPATLAEAPTADNFIGIGTQPVAGTWDTASDITATIVNGSIAFKSATIDKTFTLSNDIYTGQAGLKLSFGNVCWEYLIISSVSGYKI